MQENVAGKSIVGIGLQYGDEGKIKIFDRIVDANMWIRFNGGSNAGHNLIRDDNHYITHAIPSGFVDGKRAYIGSGCVVNPLKITGELEKILLQCDNPGTLKISAATTLVQPSHWLLDGILGKGIGTTGNGIGQAYASRSQRQIGRALKNVRLGDVLRNDGLYKVILEDLNNTIKQHGINVQLQTGHLEDELFQQFVTATESLRTYVTFDPLYVERKVQNGMDVFLEGANAVMLDVVKGDVPYVTSSHTTAAAAYVGGDVSFYHHEKTIGVAKAIMSRVGNGPFIAEFGGERSEKYCAEEGGYKHVMSEEESNQHIKHLLGSTDLFDIGIALRMLGNEYGATTYRPRRMGMLDLVMLRQNCKMNAVDELYINKVDCLEVFSQTRLEGIPVVVGYTLDGREIDYMPATVAESRRATPIVHYLPHIRDSISNVRHIDDLPASVISVLRFIEDFVGVFVYGIGVGPRSEEFVPLR